MDIIKRLFRSRAKQNYKMQIVDEDSDIIKCEVIEDGVIELDISKYHYIRLSHDNLIALLEAVEFNPTTKEP